MKHTWIISYDIADDKRRHKVYSALEGFGDRLQYSVWRAELTPLDLAHLKLKLHPLIHHREDQILLIDLGPSTAPRTEHAFTALGKPYTPPHRGPIIT